MKLKILSGRKLLIVVLIGFTFLVFLFYFIPKKSIQNSPTLLNKQGIVDSGLPARLKILGISVNATIESVGITLDGAMDTPKGANNVAWFSSGPRPGEIGSAVIDGHYGTWKNGQGSVFDNLRKLRQGDKLSIEDDKGVIISFVVRESRSYEPQADAANVFSSNDGKAHLNLITCEGVWDKTSKGYPERLVVFTDKVE